MAATDNLGVVAASATAGSAIAASEIAVASGRRRRGLGTVRMRQRPEGTGSRTRQAIHPRNSSSDCKDRRASHGGQPRPAVPTRFLTNFNANGLISEDEAVLNF